MKINGYLIIIIIGLLVLSHILMYKWGSKSAGIKEFKAGYAQCQVDYPVPSMSKPDTTHTNNWVHVPIVTGQVTGNLQKGTGNREQGTGEEQSRAESNLKNATTGNDSTSVKLPTFASASMEKFIIGEGYNADLKVKYTFDTNLFDYTLDVNLEQVTTTIHSNTQLPTPPAPPARIITKPDWRLCAGSAIITALTIFYIQK